MATPTEYRSTDSSAPVLDGTVSALIDLLDAILVSGYGAKAAAGWSKPYIGTDLAVFRQGGGGQRYLRVDDSAAQSAALNGYLSMTGVSAGAGDFPAAFLGSLYFRKSTTSDTTARPWICWATDRSFLLMGCASGTTLGDTTSNDSSLLFAEFDPEYVNDANNVILLAGSSPTSASSLSLLRSAATSSSARVPSLYGIGEKGVASLWGAQPGTTTNTGATGWTAYPDPISGGINFGRVYIYETGGVRRGSLAGLFSLGHPFSSFSNHDIFQGRNDTAGRDFMILGVNSTQGVVVETGGNWR